MRRRSHELPLTRREREVAELTTRGLTNRQIGAQQFIAERTVDTHDGQILDKLGCVSRAQAGGVEPAPHFLGFRNALAG